MSEHDVVEDLDMDPDVTVVHNEDGDPCNPSNSHLRMNQYPSPLGHPLDFSDGLFEYNDMMGGPMSPMLYEHIGTVNDTRLLHLYRSEAKRAQLAESNRIQTQADLIGEYVKARGLEIPDVSNWFWVYATREEYYELTETYPEFSAFAQKSSQKDEFYHIRFTENERALVEDIATEEPVSLDAPMSSKEAQTF